MLNITLNRSDIFQQFKSLCSFAVYNIMDSLSTDEYEIVTTYLSLLHQASEYPAGRYLVQNQTIKNTNTGKEMHYICRPNSTLVYGMKCINDDLDVLTLCGLSPAYGSTNDYDYVNFSIISANTRWNNSIALSSLVYTFYYILCLLISTMTMLEIFATNFALGVSLNIVAMFVTMQFAKYILKIYSTTGFNDVNLLINLDLSIQGTHSLALGGVFTMAISSIPSLIGYHLPLNIDYVLPSPSDYNYYIIQWIIGLSLSWYVVTGIEMAAYCIHLKVLNFWFLAMQSRLRYAILIVTMIIRHFTFPPFDTYSVGIWRLVLTRIVTIICGFFAGIIAIFFDKVPNKLDSMEKFQLETTRFVECSMAQTPDGWHLSDILL